MAGSARPVDGPMGTVAADGNHHGVVEGPEPLYVKNFGPPDKSVKRILVVDDAWKVLTHLEVSRWLQENWKLTRSTAVQCIAVVHRLSDLEAAGGRDSEQVRLARGLLADSETKVIFLQDPAELALVRDLCRLNERETAVVGSLPKGCALWKVGQRSFQVEHVLSAFERQVTYTDERMAVDSRKSTNPEAPFGRNSEAVGDE